jgi:hypothetical protein
MIPSTLLAGIVASTTLSAIMSGNAYVQAIDFPSIPVIPLDQPPDSETSAVEDNSSDRESVNSTITISNITSILNSSEIDILNQNSNTTGENSTSE